MRGVMKKKKEIEWKHPAKGKRTVAVNDEVVFIQMPSDMSGRFLPPVEHLHFE